LVILILAIDWSFLPHFGQTVVSCLENCRKFETPDSFSSFDCKKSGILITSLLRLVRQHYSVLYANNLCFTISGVRRSEHHGFIEMHHGFLWCINASGLMWWRCWHLHAGWRWRWRWGFDSTRSCLGLGCCHCWGGGIKGRLAERTCGLYDSVHNLELFSAIRANLWC